MLADGAARIVAGMIQPLINARTQNLMKLDMSVLEFEKG
jgi:hypothetical protein